MSLNEDKLVICIKWGDLYGPEYVNIMHAMVSRNLSYPFRFICFTDNAKEISSKVECLPLPELGVDIPNDAPGKWPKQALWSENLYDLKIEKFDSP